MHKISKWKLLTAFLLTIIAIIYVLPSFTDKGPNWLPGDKVNLGLDLRGGSHLLLDVDFESYLDDVSGAIADSIRKVLREKKIGYRNLEVKRNHIKFTIRNKDNIAEVKKLLRKIDSDIQIAVQEDVFILSYSEYAINQLQDKVIDQSIEIVRMRVDSTGTKEPQLGRQGDRYILLQVPGEDSPQSLKNVLGKTAKLTFHLVNQTANMEKAMKGQVPVGSKLVFDENNIPFVIYKKVIVSGDQLNNAQVNFHDAVPRVHFSFNQLGARKFAEVTKNNVGRRLAIILDGQVLSAPAINEPIPGGEGTISGNFTVESATELALLLRAGALPAPLKIIEERTVGPNLGADSIESGKKAAILGFIWVIIFMFLSYGVLGIFANITLVITLLFILSLLSMLQATLTLPGIAGIILTIGMAVDANVLIYERIREEIEKGCSNLYAVKLGFESAFATITDSNVTTLIAAFLLYSFGIGSIKGFAVTLTIGIISSMYTALVITKLMIDVWLKYYNPKNLGL